MYALGCGANAPFSDLGNVRYRFIHLFSFAVLYYFLRVPEFTEESCSKGYKDSDVWLDVAKVNLFYAVQTSAAEKRALATLLPGSG